MLIKCRMRAKLPIFLDGKNSDVAPGVVGDQEIVARLVESEIGGIGAQRCYLLLECELGARGVDREHRNSA